MESAGFEGFPHSSGGRNSFSVGPCAGRSHQAAHGIIGIWG